MVVLAALVAVVLAAGYAVAGAIASGVSAGYVPLVAGIAVLLIVAPVVLYALTARGLGWVARWVPPALGRHRGRNVRGDGLMADSSR